MKKSVYTFTAMLMFFGFLISCSEEKKEDTKETKTEVKDSVKEDVSKTNEEACLEIIADYKQAVLSSVELIEKVIGNEKKSLEDNLEILMNALTLQQQLSELGQRKLGEQCWKDFLKLQLQFVEALLKVQDKLKDGDVLSAFLESMKELKDAKQTIEEIKAIVTE
ncbi:MAG: hypothetical protein JXR58_00190 [Bacteroidales bacterium]|nr:hypothetical protein [Bacteroidales bacterium]